MQINHISSDSVFGWLIWLSGLPRSNMTWCFPAHFASWPSKWRVDFPEYLLEFFGPEVLTVCIQGGISENETEELFSLMLFRGHSANWFCNFFIFIFFYLKMFLCSAFPQIWEHGCKFLMFIESHIFLVICYFFLMRWGKESDFLPLSDEKTENYLSNFACFRLR